MKLAIDGGTPAIKEPLCPFNHIGSEEIFAASHAIRSGPLSGFLGGNRNGGYHVQALEERFIDRFGVKYAVACNSATSGLLIASRACGVVAGTDVAVPVFTMSATAAAPAFLGAELSLCDVEEDTFNYDRDFPFPVNIVTNLFGHPAKLAKMRELTDLVGGYLIEDNAQGMLAMEDGKYAGTIGHIGVFSLNVHKHVHCGEGGVCLTNDDRLADAMRLARNHGELGGGEVGLNLRMTEVEAAIALVQMDKVDEIVTLVTQQAEFLSTITRIYMPSLIPPMVRNGCRHVYYMWAPKVKRDRKWLVDALNAEGFPIRAGYVEPLNELQAFKRFPSSSRIADFLHHDVLCTFENCAYDFTSTNIREIQNAFEKVGEVYEKKISKAA